MLSALTAVTSNLMKDGYNPQFRVFRLTNPKFQEKIGRSNAAVEMLVNVLGACVLFVCFPSVCCIFMLQMCVVVCLFSLFFLLLLYQIKKLHSPHFSCCCCCTFFTFFLLPFVLSSFFPSLFTVLLAFLQGLCGQLKRKSMLCSRARLPLLPSPPRVLLLLRRQQC